MQELLLNWGPFHNLYASAEWENKALIKKAKEELFPKEDLPAVKVPKKLKRKKIFEDL